MQNSANNPSLAVIKKAMNAKVYKKALSLCNSEGIETAVDYVVKNFFISSVQQEIRNSILSGKDLV